jgi:hypothetical protein
MIYLQTILIVLGLLAIWLLVRTAAHRFAARHPEFGELRDETKGCGCGNHKCGEDECKREKH